MPPFDAVSETYGALMETTPAPETAIGAVPVIAPPPEDVTQVGHVRTPVAAFRTTGVVAPAAKVPLVFGRVRVGVPAVACGVIVTVPLVEPASPSVPIAVPDTPSTGVREKAAGDPARTPPASPVMLACPVVASIVRG